MVPPSRASLSALLSLVLWCAAADAQSSPPYYPVVSNVALDCAVRQSAWEYAQHLQPDRPGRFSDMFDSLQLGSYCGLSRPPGAGASGVAGGGSAVRALDRELRARAAASSASAFYVDSARGSDGGGGDGSASSPFASIGRALEACRLPSSPPPCSVLLFDTAPFVVSQTILLTAADSGLTISPATEGGRPLLTGALPIPPTVSWAPFNTTGGANIWAADVSSLPLASRPMMLLYGGGRRGIRARFPNGNPETDAVPDGFTNATSWLPPRPPAAPAVHIHSNVTRPEAHFFPNFTWVLNGSAVGFFEPPEGFFSSPRVVPSGLMYEPSRFSERAASWSNASAGAVFAYQGSYWGSWTFDIESHDAAAGTIVFGRGGWQEARGWPTGGALYVEHILEELDSPSEWYFDEVARRVVFFYNVSSPAPPPPGSVSLSQTERLFYVNGSAEAPVVGVSFLGLTFTGTQPTVLSRPFRAPSQGDWSFAETAAIVLEGTANATVAGCNFTRLGGNGVLVRGWNRDATVGASSFEWLGENAVVTCGNTNFADATTVDAPVRTLLVNNTFSDLGITVAQSGAYFGALSANASLVGNVAWSLPRAAFNVNDGAFGGHLLARNVVVNAMRASQDQGAYNTWSRAPYLQPTGGTAPLVTTATGNFFVSSHFSLHPFDHDDGSNAMDDFHNVVAFAGAKNFLGFAKRFDDNLVVRPDFVEDPVLSAALAEASVARLRAAVEGGGGGGAAAPNPTTPSGIPLPFPFYFPACARTVGQYAWGAALADTYTNSVCVLNATDSPYIFGTCDPSAPEASGEIYEAANNTFVTAGASVSIACGGRNLTLSQAQAVGLDVGSVAISGAGLSPAEVAQMIRDFLGF